MASSEPVSGVRILGVMLPGGGTEVAAVGPVGGGGSGPVGGQEGVGQTVLGKGRATAYSMGHVVDGIVTLGLEPRALGMNARPVLS